jgi:hypothetical protein
MVDVLERRSSDRVVPIQRAIALAVLSSLVVGVGAYFVGHEVGERDASGPSRDFVYQQQAASVRRMEDVTNQLVQIEQTSSELLLGKAGNEVDAAAFEKLRLQYIHAYNGVLAERGRLSALFDTPVLEAARKVSEQSNIALQTLYLEPGELPTETASQIDALVVLGHAARKSQWAALRKFSQLAWAEIDPHS